MITERLQQVIDEVKALSPEEQDRLAAAMRVLLQQPAVVSDVVRTDVMVAFEQVTSNSTERSLDMSDPTRYVQFRDGNWYVGTGRVEVYSVIAAWLQGASPEEIQNGFPHLALTEVYGTILYYLEHRDELDGFFRQVDAEAAVRRAQAEAARPEFYAEMRRRIANYRGDQRHSAAAS